MPWTEVLLAAAGSVVLTMIAEWRQVVTLTTTVPGDLGDPLYFAWQLAWVGRALREHPLDISNLFTTNAFQQAPDNLAYTDVVLGYAPLAWLTPDGQSGALAQLNLALLVATAMAAFGGYVLARVLGARVPGAMVAAVGSAFAPWRDTQVIHINVVSTGGVMLAAALILYGHAWSLRDGMRPELARHRVRWVLAGWLVACWQLTIGFATGIWFGYFLAVILLCLWLGRLVRVRRRRGIAGAGLTIRLLLADLIGGTAFVAAAWLLALPHVRVLDRAPEAQRVEAMLDLFSPPWFGLLTAGPANRVWGEHQASWQAAISQRWPPEMYMSPGVLLIGMAVSGLFISTWPVRRRLTLGATTAVLAVLALGTRGPAGGRYSYLPLWEYLPGWEHLRTPGRLMIWVSIGLCLLAAGAISRICDELVADWDRREEKTWRGDPTEEGPATVPGYLAGRAWPVRLGLAALLIVPAALVYAEGRDVVPHWTVTRAPVDLAALDQPVLILPTGLVTDYHLMFWSTEGWPVITNGDSGFNSLEQATMRAEAATFPDAAGVAALRRRGVATVVVVRSRVAAGSRLAETVDEPVDGLGITRSSRGDAVVYDLSP